LALDVRNRATRCGVRACGAVAEFAVIDEHGFGHLIWRHENECPVIAPAAGRQAVGL
jgi:hypothetical protein